MNPDRSIARRREEPARVIGRVPYRLALAGGWIDQPFVSALDPSPPGSMVVVNLEPRFRFMEFSGMATSTRNTIIRLWGDGLPDEDPSVLVREIYREENRDRSDPSGSQDMVGLVYPGISRLDYDARHEGGIFPVHIESCRDPGTARWLEGVLNVLPVGPRPDGYDPLEVRRIDPVWVRRLGASGDECFRAILTRDVRALGASLNACMDCWQALLPRTVVHPLIRVDLIALLRHYQDVYDGAMYSGCGGGYLIVVSERAVPGSFRIDVRLAGGT